MDGSFFIYGNDLLANPVLAASAGQLNVSGGAALFGLGWGLGGFCPGPALTALPLAAPGTFVFVVTMLSGMVLAHFGLAVALLGMASESAFSTEKLAALGEGGVTNVGPWEVTLEAVEPADIQTALDRAVPERHRTAVGRDREVARRVEARLPHR